MNDALGLADLPDLDLASVVAEQPDPVLFATVSGAHLYGFPSRDSDVDLRGVRLLPAADLVGLREPAETRSRMWGRDGVELDLVTHDLRKFVRLMLRRNGYVLEQLLSPLVVHTTDTHGELAELAPGVLTSHHAHHYRPAAERLMSTPRSPSGGSSRRAVNSSRCSTRSGCCSPASI